MADLRITHTGIRSGERITSSRTGVQNRGTVMIVRSSNAVAYPPSRHWVQQLDEITLRDAFNAFSAFRHLTLDQRRTWLLENSVPDKELYLEDLPLQVKFVKLAGKFFTDTLSPELLSTLLRGNPADPEGFWPIRTVYDLIPRKPGSRARRHTLIFRPSNWTLLADEVIVNDFSGLYFNMDTRTLGLGALTRPSGGYLRVISLEQTNVGSSIAIVSGRLRSTPLTWADLLRLADKFAPDMERVRPLIQWFPPALYKSLIQKLIRTQCRQVQHGEELFDGGSVLLAAMSLLMLHPGAFVPNIQRFVSGLESLKRVAVSINEDAFVTDNSFLTSIYAGALLAQHDRSWQPTDDLITGWFWIALMAQREPRIYDYDWHAPGILPKDWNFLTFNYVLLSELRSFESDILMLQSIASREGRAREPVLNRPWPIMPLIHCLDHHTFTEIANFMPFEPMGYPAVFQKIWNYQTGVNPRLDRFTHWQPENPIAKEVRRAQELLWLAKTATPSPRPVLAKTITFRYHLDNEWLAGLVGHLEVKLANTMAIVVLSPDAASAGDLIAIKKPSRDVKGAPELTDAEKSLAIATAREQLSRGIPLHHVPRTLSQLGGATIHLHDGQFWVTLASGVRRSWLDFVNLEYTFPLHPVDVSSMQNAILKTGTGFMENAQIAWDRMLTTISLPARRRLLTYLEGNRATLEMLKIGRDGQGLDYTVLPEDSTVYRVLSYACCLFPGVLELRDRIFHVKNGPVLWTLRKALEIALRQTSAASWPVVERPARQLWEHQRDSLSRMQARHARGKKGHIINIGTGLGKTTIVLEYLLGLMRDGQMPEYCVYTLPPSALDSIIRELTTYGLAYQVLDMRKEGKIQTLAPQRINLVLHDHLRLMTEALKERASNMLFVVDEFHKTINKTLRTSIALEVVRLSQDFVAMSGTIIKSTALEELFEWLQQVVEFEVTTHNYFVAIGALISKKVSTRVVIERSDIDASGQLRPEYYALVPKTLGGTSDRLHFKAALVECYRAILGELVNQTLGYLRLGEKVFMVVQNQARQLEVQEALRKQGVSQIWLITKDTPITLTPEDHSPIQVVITTKQHVEGYTLVDRRIAIYELFLGNQATYEQADGRLNRINQPSPVVRIITVHAGLLSYIMRRYEKARTLAEVIRGFAQELSIDAADMLD